MVLKFSDQVYLLVKRIPRGKVATYGQIASKIKHQNLKILARAVGNAMHKNRNPSVPCHRLVDRNGKLAFNFAFDGWVEQRRKLLAEGVKFQDETHVDLSKSLWRG